MGLAKKGSRRITIDETVYRWRVSPDDEPGLGIVVELYEQPGQRMVTWVEHGNTISPWLVRKVILQALSQGWKPADKAKPFLLRLEGLHEPPEPQQGSAVIAEAGPKRMYPQSETQSGH